MDVQARMLAKVQTVAELQELLHDKNLAIYEKLVLGGGSNILFTSDFDGLVIKNELKGIEVVNENDEEVFLKAGAGVVWHDLVMYAVARNYGGIENLALIPGTVGASPMQNIGAYGIEIKDTFHELEAVQIDNQHLVRFGHADCAFGYRESVFKNRYKNQFVICSVTYRLNKNPVINTSYGAIEKELELMQIENPDIKSVAEAVMRIRSSKLPDPAHIGNAGSFFKNPELEKRDFEQLTSTYADIVGYPLSNDKVKLAAGWLIEKAGWKGFRKGDAGVHDQQALVLVNLGRAKGYDIFALSEEIIHSVHEKFGVWLHREVNVH
jgi:UDP-N-acetylmuramate dehydrogenase